MERVSPYLRHNAQTGAMPGMLERGVFPRHDTRSTGHAKEPIAIMCEVVSDTDFAAGAPTELWGTLYGEIIFDTAAVISGMDDLDKEICAAQPLYISPGKAVYMLSRVAPQAFCGARFMGEGLYFEPFDIIYSPLYLLSVRKTEDLTPDQVDRLEATGCHNKGSSNIAAWEASDRRANKARYKVETCVHYTPATGKGCKSGKSCPFFHDPIDRELCQYWPHDIKVANYLAMSKERRVALEETLAIDNSNAQEPAPDTQAMADYGSEDEGDSFRTGVVDRSRPAGTLHPCQRRIPRPRPWRGTGFARGSISMRIARPDAMPASPPSANEDMVDTTP